MHRQFLAFSLLENSFLVSLPIWLPLLFSLLVIIIISLLSFLLHFFVMGYYFRCHFHFSCEQVVPKPAISQWQILLLLGKCFSFANAISLLVLSHLFPSRSVSSVIYCMHISKAAFSEHFLANCC